MSVPIIEVHHGNLNWRGRRYFFKSCPRVREDVWSLLPRAPHGVALATVAFRGHKRILFQKTKQPQPVFVWLSGLDGYEPDIRQKVAEVVEQWLIAIINQSRSNCRVVVNTHKN